MVDGKEHRALAQILNSFSHNNLPDAHMTLFSLNLKALSRKTSN